MMEINIMVEKRHVAYLVFTMAVLFGINYVIAYGGDQPAELGHTAGEIDFTGGFTVPSGNIDVDGIVSGDAVGAYSGSITNPTNYAALGPGNLVILNSGESITMGLSTTTPDIEMRDTDSDGRTPYIDFSNDANTDYDVRIRLAGDNGLAIEGGSLTFGETKPFCVFMKACPPSTSGWVDHGRAGFITQSASVCPYDVGAPYQSGWVWCHPHLCCNA
jgi:hypothetical protein